MMASKVSVRAGSGRQPAQNCKICAVPDCGRPRFALWVSPTGRSRDLCRKHFLVADDDPDAGAALVPEPTDLTVFFALLRSTASEVA